MRSFLLLFSFCMLAVTHAQVVVTGTVMLEGNETLPGATVRVLSKDSAFVTGTVTDENGVYTLTLQPHTKYNLLFSYFSMRGKSRVIPLTTTDVPVTLPVIKLKETETLKEVVVEGVQTRGEQKGDTTSFNANAYKTNPDANAEDLIKKLPGVTTDNQGTKVNGESVQKVLVDGKPFFGDDPNAALKNLPADMIDKIEIFDKASDQSQFTGFNDGNQQKTINLVTKKDRNQGYFGKVYAGGGADEELTGRYNAGASVNSFRNKRRITLLLLSNNINQQNFSSSDISGAMGGGGRRASSALMIPGQNGNTTTQSAGLNFSDEWGKKISVSGSYFYNHSLNTASTSLVRTYFTADKLVYSQENSDRNINQNHRANLRFELNIDSANRLLLSPSLTMQDNSARSALSGVNVARDLILLSSTGTESKNENLAYDFNNNVLFQHRFRKKGRTFSINVSTLLSERTNAGSYQSENFFGDSTTSGLDQLFGIYSFNKRLGGSVSWTEPVGENAQLQFNYSPSYSEAKSDKVTRDYDALMNEYDIFNASLSNKYNNIYTTQRAGASYKYKKEKLSLEAGADVQQASLQGDQVFPYPFAIDQTFNNVLPNASMNYKFTKTRNLRVHYRSSTNIPNTAQLQNVLDISNPIQVRAGNPGLRQSLDHSLNLRLGGFDPVTARNIMFFLNASASADYIGNATYIIANDTALQNAVLKPGSQLTMPVNLQGYYSGRSFLTFGFPVKAIKSNVSLNAGFNYGRTPSIINYVINYSNSYSPNGGLYIGSNISKDLDFSLSYNAAYTAVDNSWQKRSNNSFFTHTAAFRLNWIFWKGFVINTDITHTTYNGLAQSFSQQFLLWNGYFGYKFLKDKTLEVKLSVFDILNQNRSISRTITSAYTEDNRTTVLRRYALLTVTYNFKKFKSGGPPVEDNERPPHMGPRHERRN